MLMHLKCSMMCFQWYHWLSSSTCSSTSSSTSTLHHRLRGQTATHMVSLSFIAGTLPPTFRTLSSATLRFNLATSPLSVFFFADPSATERQRDAKFNEHLVSPPSLLG